MDIGNGLLLSIMVMVATLLWAGLLFVVPRHLTSLFRYKLWQLRDAVVDDVIEGRLQQCELIDDLVRHIEALIRSSADLTLLTWCSIPPAPESYVKEKLKFIERGLRDLSEQERQRFHDYLSDLRNAVVKHLVTGSAAAWILLLVGVIILFPRELLKGVRNRVANVPAALRDAIRSLGLRYIVAEANLVGFISVMSSSTNQEDSERPLSACVG